MQSLHLVSKANNWAWRKKLKLLKLVIPFDGLPKVFAFEVDEKFVFGVCAPSLETTLQALI